jgi:hypothetical protein
MFTGGSVMERFRELPGGRGKGGFVLRAVTASDGETEFKVRGQVRFGGTEEAGTFTVHLVIIGPGGRFGTVRETATFSEGDVTVDSTGTCSLRFQDHEHEDGDEHEHEEEHEH